MSKTNIYTKILSLSSLVIAIFLVIKLFVFSSTPDAIINRGENIGEYAIYSLDIPDSISFAGERVPLEQQDVKESLDRELLVNTYWQSQTILFIKRANRYFPVIEPILKEYGVPDDFKFLALIESGLMPRAVSPAGAAGLWQFMRTTAREYGLEVNKEVDERYNVEKATVAACRYFKKAYDHYGNWTLAAASYNAGKTGIAKQLTRQKTDNYYDLLLGEETGRYVYRILAVKEILNNPDKYGFHVKQEDKYPPYKTIDVEITGPVKDFADFAKEHNISYKRFKNLNPWLRETYLTNSSGKKYIVKVPEE
ncbi:MAG: lytic transglycosylase domain-containing protein [Chlorobi bacterium]|nr:lytic transglycosylase domain-containing protein [Chlorobiota bacterium]